MAVLLVLAGSGMPSLAGTLTLPSGLEAELHEVIHETGEDGPVARFRYVAAALATAPVPPEAVFEDMSFLCKNSALPQLEPRARDQVIVISMADRPAPFGVMDASVTQFFEVFRATENICIWEAF